MTSQPSKTRETSRSSDTASSAIDDLATAHKMHLTELGAESRAERQAKRVIPWIVSFAIHGVLILMGFLITWSIVTMSPEEEPIVVIADFDSLIFDPIAELKLDHAIEEQTVETDLDLLPLDQPFEEMMPSFETEIALPTPEAMHGAQPMDFAPAPARGSASFMGVSTTNAQQIVYVIDASGAMIAYMPIILSHLRNSLDALSPEQRFAIIFYQGGSAHSFPAGGGLSEANAREKDRALTWADGIVPRQVSNPIPAFEVALRMQPDAVFVLSANITAAGRFEVDQSELLARLDQLNPVDRTTGARRTQINCIQFLDPDPLDTMRLISQQHGGERGYRFYSRRDLGL